MADNIKIIGNINSTEVISRYENKDINLISSTIIQENFGGQNDYIEFYVYDAVGNLLNINYNYLSYKLPSSFGLTPGTSNPPNTTGNIQTTDVGIDSTLATPTSSLYPIIEIDPIKDLQDIGYSSGEFNVRYNIFHNTLSNFQNQALFVKEISQDRTEIRLASTTLTNDEIESTVLSIIDEINNSTYYVDYLLNFGGNEQYVAVNIALNKAPEGYEVLFKLYQPLPLNIQEKDTLWVVSEKANPYVFDINLDRLVIQAPAQQLRGPNFSIEIPNQSTVSTQYNTYSNLVTGLQSLQQTSYHQILNLLATQSANINVDYTNYNDFVFFGSAYHRLNNFYDKAKQIEDYNNLITTYTPLTSSKPSLITEINTYSSSISTIISQFDGYESYLYFESSSYTWPKSGSIKPFSLLSTGSAAVLSWYPALTASAKDYDLNNYDNLEYAVPNFIKDDENNAPFLLFLNMIGHYFDNIWVYFKSVTDINLANNNLDYGISKDLVYERLQSLGIRLYNSQAGESVDQYLVGANTGSSVWDNNYTITGSYLNNIPRKDLVSELYKRIYHNLPLLLKTKGTVAGLDHLTTIFGITGSILNVKEFGGSLKSNLINGYNNDKVRIVDNSIAGNPSGSVLSPFLSLQTFPVTSSQFRENDMNYVDVSFSPQTQIDTYISGAIAKNNTTWSLDDYIGDPRQQYSSSYPDLDAQRKLYFETGTPTSLPFTGSNMDYNGFIRLIQYFDNALFKMLNDFVPERTSLSTGVTFNSPVLERNKAVYANPTNTTTQSVYEGEVSSSTISSQYGAFYNTLSSSNNTMGWYDGELSGSIVNIGQYFEDNPNPYLGDWNVYNTQNPLNENINQNTFAHSDWNVLLNNVSKSVVSNIRKKIEYTGNLRPTSSITSSVELQDSNLSLRSYNTSRYEGSKTISLKYNTYTEESGNPYNVYDTVSNVSSSFTINYSYTYNITASVRVFPPTTPNTFTIQIQPTTPVNYSVVNLYVPRGGQFETQVLQNLKNSKYIRAYASSNVNIGNNEGKIYEIKGYTRRLIPVTNPTLTNYNTISNEIMIFVSEKITATNNNPTITQNITPLPSVPDKLVNLEFLNINSNYWIGDKSFGKTAAVDRQSYKVGWVKNIPSQSLNFLDKTQIQLKYLVDANQNLTDLTLKNNNLVEVQNTFKSGDTVVLSLSDAIKPSFQKTLDGTKTIFRGGYSYDPIFFRENYEPLEIKTNGFSSTTAFAGIKSTDKNFYTGNNSNDSPVNLWWDPTWGGVGCAPDRVPVQTANQQGFRWSTNMRGREGVFSPVGTETTIMASADTMALYNSNYSSYIQGREWLSGDVNTITNAGFSNVPYGTYSTRAGRGGGGTADLDAASTYAYYFDLLKPKKVVDNEDIDTTDGGTYLYKAPRASTYDVKAGFAFTILAKYHLTDAIKDLNAPSFRGISRYHVHGVNFRIFGILEGNTDPVTNPTNWKYKASTRITEFSSLNGKISINKEKNIIHLNGGEGEGAPWDQQPIAAQNDHIAYFGMRLLKDTATNTNNVSDQTVQISLVQNEVLRLRVVMLDLNFFWKYGRQFIFDIGTPNNDVVRAEGGNSLTETGTRYPIQQFNNIPNLIKETYFEIEDPAVPKVQYDETVTLNGDVFSSTGSNITLLNNLFSIYPLSSDSSSIFIPVPPTSNYYSPVIDNLQIQPNDLIRVGSINNPTPEYYTVLSVGYNTLDFTLAGNLLSFNVNAQFIVSAVLIWNTANTQYSTIIIPYSTTSWLFFQQVLNSPSRTFTVRGTNTVNDKSYTLANPNTFTSPSSPVLRQNFGGDFIFLAVSPNLFTGGTPTILLNLGDNPSFAFVFGYELWGGGVPVTFSQTVDLNQLNPYFSSKINISLDKSIPSGSRINQNFAILRPKPDETSVIVNFKKALGDVSQTILIPQDANDEIKNKVGTIFQSLNVDLSNQSQNNTQ